MQSLGMKTDPRFKLGESSRSYGDNVATESRSPHDRFATIRATISRLCEGLIVGVRARKLEVSALLEAARNGGGRSPLYEWLWAQHGRLAPELGRYGVNWDALAERFATAGIMAGRGVTPNAKSVRQTWNRVCRDKTKDGARPEKAPDTKLKAVPFTLPIEETTAPTNKFGPAKPKGKS